MASKWDGTISFHGAFSRRLIALEFIFRDPNASIAMLLSIGKYEKFEDSN